MSVPTGLLVVFFQKRQLAVQSHTFNLKDPVFCELFPEIVEVSANVPAVEVLQNQRLKCELRLKFS